MVSREGDLERKWYMVGFEEMLILDNMKIDIMVLGNGDFFLYMYIYSLCVF